MNLCSNKIIGVLMISLLLCPVATALGQSPNSTAHSSTSPGVRSWDGEGSVSAAYKMRVNKCVHLTDAARAALRAEDYQAAEDYAQQAIDTRIDVGLGQQLMVDALHAEGRDMEALPLYQTMSEEKMKDPQYELPYALLLLKTGHWSQAVAVYNETLPFVLDGDLLRAQNNFSPTVQRTKDLETAIHIGMGIHCLSHTNWAGKSQNNEGLLNLRQAIALAPSSALAHYQYGLGLARVGRPAEAKAAFKKAVALDEGDVKEAAQKELPATVQPK